MSKKISVSVEKFNIYDTKNFCVVSYDINIDGKCHHRVIAQTTKKFKQSLKTKIAEYCKRRQK